MKHALAIFLVLVPLQAKDTCLECHSSLEGKLGQPAAVFQNDVHSHRGFGCASCHGGDPSAEDPDVAMSPARGFRVKMPRTAVPRLCARCHSDANPIHKFNPKQRVDQLIQYMTSVHGKRLAAGDTAVANCVDCHGAHGVREVGHPLSPVHPLRLPETCAKCHSEAARMAKYGLPANQLEEYHKSVHWEALVKRRDLSAPSCASCHGNHGATPPQVTSVAAVCGTCHVLLEDLYAKSPHQPVFAAMGAGGCVVCHGNHAVLRPTTGMLAGGNSVCAECHDPDSPGGKAALEMARLITGLGAQLDLSGEVLAQARRSGMDVSGALLRQMEGHEHLVKARVAVHAFRIDAVKEPVDKGLAIATETHRSGEAALREREIRRIGLALSLVTILATMAGLWLAIRAIERRQQGASVSPQGGE